MPAPRTLPVRLGGEPTSTEQIREMAIWFYLRGLSQVQIARKYGIDPSTVSRYLKRARDEGIVYVEIRTPRRVHVDLGREVAARFGLDRAVVVPDTQGLDDALHAVAAEFIGGTLRTGMHLGVSWGQTLASVVRFLQARSVSDLYVAQLTGGLSDAEPGNQCHELVRTIAQLYPNSRVKYLHTPAIVDTAAIRHALMQNRSTREALAVAAASEIALVGVGSMGTDATLIRVGSLDDRDRADLGTAKAVGTINGRFFREDGSAVDVLEERTIAVSWDELRGIPMVIAVAAGPAKVRAILGGLRTGAIDVLVTDEPTAQALLATRPTPTEAQRASAASEDRDGVPG